MASIAERLLPLRIRLPRVPVAVQFTREGLVFVLLSLAIGAAAVNTGNNILYLIFSTMLALIVVSGMLSRRMLSGLRPKLEFPSSIFASVRNLCFVTLKNAKPRSPSLGIRMVMKGNSFPDASAYFFYIPPKAQNHAFIPILFPRRGVYNVQNIELQTRFPFSFFLKIRHFSLQQRICVYPQIFRLSDEWVQRFTEGFLAESPFRGESHQLLHLREYSPNDSSRRIHWKASAKAEKFLVKEFLKEQGRELRILFDCYAATPQEGPIMEQAISLTASLAYLLRRRGMEAVFIFADHHFRVGEREAQVFPMLEHLAEIEAGHVPTEIVKYPENRNMEQALIIRSRKIAPILELPSSGRILVVEESVSKLTEPLADEVLQGGRP